MKKHLRYMIMKDKIISGMSTMLLLFVILSLQSFAISPGDDFNVNVNEFVGKHTKDMYDKQKEQQEKQLLQEDK